MSTTTIAPCHNPDPITDFAIGEGNGCCVMQEIVHDVEEIICDIVGICHQSCVVPTVDGIG